MCGGNGCSGIVSSRNGCSGNGCSENRCSGNGCGGIGCSGDRGSGKNGVAGGIRAAEMGVVGIGCVGGERLLLSMARGHVEHVVT